MAETYTNTTQPTDVYRYHASTDTLEKTVVTQVTTGGETGLRYLMVFPAFNINYQKITRMWFIFKHNNPYSEFESIHPTFGFAITRGLDTNAATTTVTSGVTMGWGSHTVVMPIKPTISIKSEWVLTYTCNLTMDTTVEGVIIYYEDSGGNNRVAYYDGSSWVDCVPHYYDGSSWVECSVSYYDGSTWQACGG